MVGDLDKSSFSNIEQQSLEFVKYTLDPWVIRWEQSLQRSLLLPGEKGKYFAHTLNNTVVAPPRMLIAFLENNLNEDGSINIPEALRPYMGGMDVIR